MHAWVIGSGGLLGSAIVEHARPRALVFDARPIDWSDPVAAASTLTEDLRRFADATGDDDWVILWAAGSSVVSSSPQDTQPELVIFGALVDAVADHRPAGRGSRVRDVLSWRRVRRFDPSTVRTVQPDLADQPLR